MRIKIHHAECYDFFLLANSTDTLESVMDRARDLGAEIIFHPRQHRTVLVDINSRNAERHGNSHRQHCPIRHHADKRGPFPREVA